MSKINRQEYFRRYRIDNKTKLKRYYGSWYKKNNVKARQKIREKQRKLKLIIINHYSKGKNCCACCDELLIEFLTIDHIRGDGNKHRKKHKSNHIYDWLIKHNFPEGFMVLCMNCNFSKGKYGYCPHDLKIIRKFQEMS